MRVLIAGGHGQIALRITQLLAARGDEVVGLIRNPEHADDVRAVGGTPLLVDLEHASAADIAVLTGTADAAVFAAGAGPGSGPERKDTVDRGSAVRFAEACEKTKTRRFVQISSMGTEHADDPKVEAAFRAYLHAKREAEKDLRRRDLDWTILRPGHLTDGPATGKIDLDFDLDPGEISRADVAALVVLILGEHSRIGQVLEAVAAR